MTDDYDLIQAFADGEPVEPDALDRALANPDGRQHLIDVLVLRGFVTNPQLAPPVVVAPARSRTPSILRWSIAAVITLSAAAGGYVAGERVTTNRERAELAVAVAATAPPPSQAAQTAPATAPEPTRVIRFENGVDWTEHQGGH